MDYADIARTIARLRAELNQIGVENRLYFVQKKHSELEVQDHQGREDRVREIKSELQRLMPRKIA